MKINAIITGSTGMVGEGVLMQCLKHPEVENVLAINRRSCGIKHDKLKELIHHNFTDLKEIEEHLSGYNACFFCLGISSVGIKEEFYKRVTYDLTMTFANTLVKLNPDMTFCYISGAGTDSTEQGRSMWARIKGKTENSLLKLPFRASYMFRPGYIQPASGQKNAHTFYKVIGILYPLWKLILPKYVLRMENLGDAMINSVLKGYPRNILESRDIKDLSIL